MNKKHGVWIVVLLVILGVFGLWYVSHAPGTDLLTSTERPNVYEPDQTTDVDVSDVTAPRTPDDVDDMVFCTMDAKQCPDGSYVGRTGPDCEFSACPDSTDAPSGSAVQYCTVGPDSTDACAEIYQPVCADVQVECITTPCNPVKETFSNTCFACANDRVISYVEGACANE